MRHRAIRSFLFSDPLCLDDVKDEPNLILLGLSNGNSFLGHEVPTIPAIRGPNYQRPMPASKKKQRKSSAEKFLEDNADYYGIQVLNSKLRSSSEGGEASPEEAVPQEANGGEEEVVEDKQQQPKQPLELLKADEVE